MSKSNYSLAERAIAAIAIVLLFAGSALVFGMVSERHNNLVMVQALNDRGCGIQRLDYSRETVTFSCDDNIELVMPIDTFVSGLDQALKDVVVDEKVRRPMIAELMFGGAK